MSREDFDEATNKIFDKVLPGMYNIARDDRNIKYIMIDATTYSACRCVDSV